MAEQLNVSRTPVREALDVLVGEGLLERVAGTGWHVKPLDARTIAEFFQLRVALESYAIEAGSDTLNGTQLQRLEEVFAHYTDQDIDYRTADWYILDEADRYLHSAIVSRLQNRLAEQLIDSLSNRAAYIRAWAWSDHSRVGTACEEHLSIIRSLRTDDRMGAMQAIRQHLDSGKQSLLSVLAEPRSGRALAPVRAKSWGALTQWIDNGDTAPASFSALLDRVEQLMLEES